MGGRGSSSGRGGGGAGAGKNVFSGTRLDTGIESILDSVSDRQSVRFRVTRPNGHSLVYDLSRSISGSYTLREVYVSEGKERLARNSYKFAVRSVKSAKKAIGPAENIEILR